MKIKRVGRCYSSKIRQKRERIKRFKEIFFIFLLAWFFSTLSFLILYSLGYYLSRAEGKSMEPYLKGNCILLFKKLKDPRKEIKVGDIVEFYGGKEMIVHRVIGKCEVGSFEGFETKGDNNPYSDGCRPFDYFVGKLIWKFCLKE